jgi:hypothetical protein
MTGEFGAILLLGFPYYVGLILLIAFLRGVYLLGKIADRLDRIGHILAVRYSGSDSTI